MLVKRFETIAEDMTDDVLCDKNGRLKSIEGTERYIIGVELTFVVGENEGYIIYIYVHGGLHAALRFLFGATAPPPSGPGPPSSRGF